MMIIMCTLIILMGIKESRMRPKVRKITVIYMNLNEKFSLRNLKELLITCGCVSQLRFPDGINICINGIHC